MSEYPSLEEAIHLVYDGNIQNMPSIICADIERAYCIYGTQAEYVLGKLTKKAVSRLPIDNTLKEEIKHQHVYTDVMRICSLVSMAVPLYLVLQCKLRMRAIQR